MKKSLITLIAVIFILALALPAFADKPAVQPTGKMLFNLQIVGKVDCKTEPLDETNRHSIFVLLNYIDPNAPLNGDLASTLNKTNKIFLSSSGIDGDFQVLDGNACDGDGARFLLPDPQMGGEDTLNNPTFAYQVWVRGLGKPGVDDINDPDAVYAKIRTCAIDTVGTADTADDTIVCSTEQVTVQRTKGQPKWQNVTKELLSICVNNDLDPQCDERVAIFDDAFYNYFWEYDNHGLKNCQLRFTSLP